VLTLFTGPDGRYLGAATLSVCLPRRDGGDGGADTRLPSTILPDSVLSTRVAGRRGPGDGEHAWL